MTDEVVTLQLFTSGVGIQTASAVIPYDAWIVGVDIACSYATVTSGSSFTGRVALNTLNVSATFDADAGRNAITTWRQACSFVNFDSTGCAVGFGGVNKFIPTKVRVDKGTQLYSQVNSTNNAAWCTVLVQIVQRFPPETEPRGSNVAEKLPVMRLAGSEAFSDDDLKKLSRIVLKGTDAYRCCEQAGVRALGNTVALLNDVLEAFSSATSTTALALVPGGQLLSLRVITISETAATAPLVPGLIVLFGGLSIQHLAQSKAAYETLALVGEIIATIQRTFIQRRRGDPCYKCVEQRALSQGHPRQRQTIKGLLRRIGGVNP